MRIPNIYLLLKPSSHYCNLDCTYCFYKRVSEVYPKGKVMTVDTARTIIEKTLDTGAQHVSFTWQGGEPTLMGLDFYREVTSIQDKYRKPGQVIENTLQTNGVLLDAEWADFLKKRKFLVGLSLDGPADIHDTYRTNPKGEGTHSRVVRAASLLRERGVLFNILVLLSRANIGEPERLYRYLREQEFTHLQFIPCVEHNPDTGELMPFSVSGEELGRFHTALFDLWMEDGFTTVSIRIFEDIFIYLIDGMKVSCGWLDRCGAYLLVEHNGDVYPCDFFVYPQWKLGNLVEDSIGDVYGNPKRLAFGQMKARLPETCATCEHLAFCRGDCTKFRANGRGGYTDVSLLCEARKMLLEHIAPRTDEVRRRVMEIRNSLTGPEASKVSPVGRNDPCPCGSGQKYKRCCGRA